MRMFGIIVIIALFVGMGGWIAYGTQDSLTVTVSEKERICSGSDNGTECKYLIFTDKEVFENTDTFWYLKYNSSDIYNQLKVGNTYRVKVYGFRMGFFSMYRNIVSVRKTE